MTFDEWLARWRLPEAAIDELARVVWDAATGTPNEGSEAYVQSVVRLQAAKSGAHLWRNNVGAAEMKRGGYVRFGLANDSPKLNAVLKSADLIGWRPHVVVPDDVGKKVAIFLSVECKSPTWRPGSDPRYAAQLRWAEAVRRDGGDAQFVRDPSQLVL